MLCGQSLIPFHFITSDPLVQETVTDSSRNCRFFTRCTGQNFSNQLILFFCCPYFVLIFMSKCFWTTSIFCTNPNPNCIMKSFFIYSLWCFWPFSLAVQFHTLFLVFITIFHKNTPNTGCPVLGVHIILRQPLVLHENKRKAKRQKKRPSCEERLISLCFLLSGVGQQRAMARARLMASDS